jgi:RNA recognition motif-containing protein
VKTLKVNQGRATDKTLRLSDVRLKVRNIDEKQVSNDDIKKLFAKIGELKVCRFDRNEFGSFLGSATVVYVHPEDAKKAIKEYHGAFLDDKVITVEYGVVPHTQKQTPSTGKEKRISKDEKTPK